MKKATARLWNMATSLVVFLALVGVVFGQQNNDPRGDHISTKANQALEQCFDSIGIFVCGPSLGGVTTLGGTTNTIAKFTGAQTIGDSLFSDDGTNVTLASGQFLLPDGLPGTPAWGFFSDNDGTGTGAYRGGANVIRWGTNGILRLQLSGTQLLVQMSGTAATPSLGINEGDTGLYRIGDNRLGITVGGARVVEFDDTNVAGGSADLVTISSTTGIMDGGDTFRGFVLNIASDNHTGGGNILAAIDVESIVGDPSVTEYAIRLAGGFDFGIAFLGADENIFYDGSLTFAGGVTTSQFILQDVNAAGGSAELVEIDSSGLGVMDGSDIVRGLFIDIENVDHTGTGNLLIALDVDGIIQDADAFETAARFGSGFDAHFTLVERGGAYADFPPAGSQAFFVDDNADWSGGGGNDCALVWQDSTGATTVIAIRVTDGPCS